MFAKSDVFLNLFVCLFFTLSRFQKFMINPLVLIYFSRFACWNVLVNSREECNGPISKRSVSFVIIETQVPID